MRKLASVAIVGLFAIATLAANESFKNVPLVDVNCSKKVAADPDSHTRACALKCQASGYAIITPKNKVVTLDAAGNEDVAAALKASDKKDHLRADVSGDLEGDTLHVTSFKLM